MLKYLVSGCTATGDTTKTLIDTITLPAGSKGIVGAWCYGIAGAGFTSQECMTGILELESPDINLQPCQLPLEPAGLLTSGAISSQIHIFQMNAAVKGSERISGYVTMDMAITVASKARFGLVVDVG